MSIQGLGWKPTPSEAFYLLPSVKILRPMSGFSSNTHLAYFSIKSRRRSFCKIETVRSHPYSERNQFHTLSAFSRLSGRSKCSLRSADVILVIRFCEYDAILRYSFISLSSMQSCLALLSISDEIPDLDPSIAGAAVVLPISLKKSYTLFSISPSLSASMYILIIAI